MDAGDARKRETPIELALNIGPVVSRELRALGILTLEDLRALGWERAFMQWVHAYPKRLHPVACYALAGAVSRVNIQKVSPEIKEKARELTRRMKAELKNAGG